MGFAVCHVTKGKGSGRARGKHIDREEQPKNADPEKAKLNIEVVRNEKGEIKTGALGCIGTLSDRIAKRIDEGHNKKRKVKTDAVTHVSFVVTGSHDEMKAIENDEIKRNDWINSNFEFFENKYGKENVVGFAVHRDEYTMHAHVIVVPLTTDGRLSAREILGHSEGLKELQTSYASMLEKKGFTELKRGVEGSKAKHTDVKQFYGMVKDALDTEKTQKEKLELNTPDLWRAQHNDKHDFKHKDVIQNTFSIKTNFGLVDKEDAINQVDSIVKRANEVIWELQKNKNNQIENVVQVAQKYIKEVDEKAKSVAVKNVVLLQVAKKTLLKERQKPNEKGLKL